MNANEKKLTEKIRSQYVEPQHNKLDELRELNAKAERPAKIIAYTVGILGALILGIGMCLAMPSVIEGFMPLGIVIGVVGIAIVAVNYPLYKRLLARGREKYKSEILALSDELLNRA